MHHKRNQILHNVYIDITIAQVSNLLYDLLYVFFIFVKMVFAWENLKVVTTCHTEYKTLF